MLILFYNTMWGHVQDYGPGIEGTEFSTDLSRYDEADAVVFHLPEWPEEPPIKRPGQLWVAWSMECEEHYPRMKDSGFMRSFDLTMTYKQNSDVPLNYADPGDSMSGMIEAFRRPPSAHRQDPLVAAFISSRFDLSGRRAYLEELAQHLAIDSYGKFMSNRALDPDHGRSTKWKTISTYKFTIAFENACAEDYVTEKFFDPLRAGSVPIYLGAPNAEAFAPGDHCFIDVAAYPDPQSLAKYLLVLGQNDDMYNSYFAWKKKPFRKRFEALLADHVNHWLIRLDNRVRHRLTFPNVCL